MSDVPQEQVEGKVEGQLEGSVGGAVQVRCHVVIPARYGSSRLPAKPLALIGGMPMVVRTAQSVAGATPLSVTVATDDERIREVVERAGFSAMMTRMDHPSGSDRVLEVAERLAWPDDAIVINVQGDEPLLPPSVIRQLTDALERSSVGVATLCERIRWHADVFNPNIVKVVRDHQQKARYFSRAPVPWQRGVFDTLQDRTPPIELPDSRPGWHRHIGVYAYRLSALRAFVRLPVGGLESTESLEQLRLLESGIEILVLDSAAVVPGGVDTPEDLQRVNDAVRWKS